MGEIYSHGQNRRALEGEDDIVAMDHHHMRPARADMVVKNVEGRLLRREESYTETTFPDSADEHTEDEVVLHQNLHQSEAYAFDAAALSPKHSANVSPALQRTVRAWCEATGLPTTITVRCRDHVFHLHKFPLVSRSGYFKRALKDAKDVAVAAEVPGGVEILELALRFCYGATILMEPANVAELACVAEYLQMTEDFGRANLDERSELYLNQVALQSWDDALVVLLRCENLRAERLATQCLGALAFMACVEALGSVARKAAPGRTGALQCWETTRASLPLWIHDLVALPPALFVKMVVALRREGLPENAVGRVVTAFADRHLFGSDGADRTVLVQKGSDKCWVMESQSSPELPVLLEAVARVLPLEPHVVPLGFLFALLRRALACAADCRVKLETRIALDLEHATLDDVLLPGKDVVAAASHHELDAMERIVALFLSRFRGYDETSQSDAGALAAVGKLWDAYLAEIASDANIAPARFAELVDRIPAYMRVAHDHVYRAIHTYLKAHPSCTQEDRLALCRPLNCQKLSHDVCAHAAQNDLMPIRVIVQAMFMQQLQTRTSTSQSFREPPPKQLAAHPSRVLVPEPSTSFFYPAPPVATASSRYEDSFRSVDSSNDLYIDDLMYAASQVKKESVEVDHYHATETRLRSLEAELSKMRSALAHSMNQQSSRSSRRKAAAPVEDGHVEVICAPVGCLAHLHPASRTSGGLLAKTLQRLTRFRSTFATKAKPAARRRSSAREPVISAPIVDPGSLPGFPQMIDRPEAGARLVGRNDSMPLPVSGSGAHKPNRHVRHRSFS